jgi:hypothetical protein
MTALDTASLVFYPSGYKESKLYSIKPTDGTGDLTFTRASSATRVNSQGLIESVATNIPRIDYTGGGCGKLLLEPQRTNLITYSNDFSNAAWTKIGASVTSGFTSPDGSTNAFKLVESATAGEHYLEDTVSATTNNTYTQSIFVKQFTADYGFIISVIGIGSSSTVSSAKFNILNGLVSTGTIGGLITSSKVTLLTNGQYKCSVTYTLNGTVTSHRMRIRTGTSLSYTGDGTSGLYIYGAQLEAGSYATSYIPTSGTTVTKIKDASSTTGLSSVIGQTEGTLFCEIELTSASEQILIITSAVGNEVNRLQIYIDSSRKIGLYRGDASVSILSSSAYAEGSILKIAAVYKSNDYALYINGVSVGTDTSATIPPTPSVLYLGSYVDGSKSNSVTVNQAQLYTTRLTNEQLTDLTGTVHTTFNSLALSLGYTIL